MTLTERLDRIYALDDMETAEDEYDELIGTLNPDQLTTLRIIEQIDDQFAYAVGFLNEHPRVKHSRGIKRK